MTYEPVHPEALAVGDEVSLPESYVFAHGLLRFGTVAEIISPTHFRIDHGDGVVTGYDPTFDTRWFRKVKP